MKCLEKTIGNGTACKGLDCTLKLTFRLSSVHISLISWYCHAISSNTFGQNVVLEDEFINCNWRNSFFVVIIGNTEWEKIYRVVVMHSTQGL